MATALKKNKKEKNYLCKLKITAQKKRDIEACAKAKGMTFNRFIKDAINQNITSCKSQMNDSGVLHNQLELFNGIGTQLGIKL